MAPDADPCSGAEPDRSAGPSYLDYIASPAWASLRQQALARDGFRCRGCDTTERLEVHHRRYGLPHGTETVDDLTTLCGGPDGCHAAITQSIRSRRYQGRTHAVAPVARLTPGSSEAVHVLSAFEVPVHRRVTPGHAQREAGEPVGPYDQGTEPHHEQAGQDRRRS